MLNISAYISKLGLPRPMFLMALDALGASRLASKIFFFSVSHIIISKVSSHLTFSINLTLNINKANIARQV